MSFDPATAYFSYSGTGAIGNYSIVVIGKLPNLQMTTETFNVIVDAAPTYPSGISDVTVSVGKTLKVSLAATDLDSLYVTLSSPVVQGTSSPPVFTTFASPYLTISPTLFT